MTVTPLAHKAYQCIKCVLHVGNMKVESLERLLPIMTVNLRLARQIPANNCLPRLFQQKSIYLSQHGNLHCDMDDFIGHLKMPTFKEHTALLW